VSAARSKPTAIRSVGELLAHALEMEQEAAERFEELADQLEAHNNREVAAAFRKMAAAEREHVGHVEELAGGRELPHIAPWEFRWKGAEAPETIAPEEIHYLMRPREAVALALKHERDAVEFFEELARDARRADVREMAERLAREEREHCAYLEQWLARLPREAAARDDPDPPNQTE
jgi:rubrerythrin